MANTTASAPTQHPLRRFFRVSQRDAWTSLSVLAMSVPLWTPPLSPAVVATFIAVTVFALGTLAVVVVQVFTRHDERAFWRVPPDAAPTIMFVGAGVALLQVDPTRPWVVVLIGACFGLAAWGLVTAITRMVRKPVQVDEP